MSVGQFFNDFYKEKKDKKSSIQSGIIIVLTKQDEGADYYNIEIEGKVFSNVACPIPPWLNDQLKLNDTIRGIIKNNLGFIITDKRTVDLKRTPIFNEGDSVQVIFEDNLRTMCKISLEKSGKRYVQLKIIYV